MSIGAMNTRNYTLVVLTTALAFVVVPGCGHHTTHVQKARTAFLSGDLDAADRHLDKLIGKRTKKDEALLADKAMVSLLRGDVERSEELLRQVRDGFDHLEQPDVAESTLSMLSDDLRRAYAGEDYERILVRNLLAIANLLGDGDDALAYCLQANQKQQEIFKTGVFDNEVNPKLAYKRVGLAAYLYGVVQEESHRNYDDAQRAYATVARWNPAFRMAASDLHRVQTSSHSKAGHGVLYVIALVGAGPLKEEVVAPVTSQSLAIAAHLIHAIGDHDVPPLSAAVKIPQVVVQPPKVDSVLTSVAGKEIGATETITDVGKLAVDHDAAVRDHTIARAVVRRVVKKAAIYKAKDQLSQSPWSAFALDASGLIWEATESADTRCWTTLPGMIQVLRYELPEGTHEVSLRPINRGRAIGGPHSRRLRIVDGRNTYVLACFPDQRLSGNIVCSKGI